MNVSPSPAIASTGELPCQSDPDRWFDRTDLTHPLAGCLACPARSWCAREALAVQARWGMWAGIWIDRNLADVAHNLRAVADIKPATAPPQSPTIDDINAPQRSPVIHQPAKPTVAGMITARSSGHCEIMAPDCRLALDSVASRIPGWRCDELPDAAAGYAVCQRCQAAIIPMEPRLARRLGYIIDSPADATTVPFYWRQCRWLRLDSVGGAAPYSSAERVA